MFKFKVEWYSNELSFPFNTFMLYNFNALKIYFSICVLLSIKSLAFNLALIKIVCQENHSLAAVLLKHTIVHGISTGVGGLVLKRFYMWRNLFTHIVTIMMKATHVAIYIQIFWPLWHIHTGAKLIWNTLVRLQAHPKNQIQTFPNQL